MNFPTTNLFRTSRKSEKSSVSSKSSHKARKVNWNSVVKLLGEFILKTVFEVQDIQRRGGAKNRLEASKVLLVASLKQVSNELEKAA